MVVEKGQRPIIPEGTPQAFQDLIENCWNQDPKVRKDFLEILEELDQMENDEALKDETDSFMGSKEEWEVEYGEALESQRTEKHS